MEHRRRTWLVVTGTHQLRIIQVTGPLTVVDEIIRHDGDTAEPETRPPTPREGGGSAVPPGAGRAGSVELCAAGIVNTAASLGLLDGLILMGPSPSMQRVSAALHSATATLLVATIATDLAVLPDNDPLIDAAPYLVIRA